MVLAAARANTSPASGRSNGRLGLPRRLWLARHGHPERTANLIRPSAGRPHNPAWPVVKVSVRALSAEPRPLQHRPFAEGLDGFATCRTGHRDARLPAFEQSPGPPGPHRRSITPSPRQFSGCPTNRIGATDCQIQPYNVMNEPVVLRPPFIALAKGYIALPQKDPALVVLASRALFPAQLSAKGEFDIVAMCPQCREQFL